MLSGTWVFWTVICHGNCIDPFSGSLDNYYPDIRITRRPRRAAYNCMVYWHDILAKTATYQWLKASGGDEGSETITKFTHLQRLSFLWRTMNVINSVKDYMSNVFDMNSGVSFASDIVTILHDEPELHLRTTPFYVRFDKQEVVTTIDMWKLYIWRTHSILMAHEVRKVVSKISCSTRANCSKWHASRRSAHGGTYD